MAIKHATTKAPGDLLYAVADWNADHTGTGAYDSHLINTSNPHSVTSTQVGAVDLVSNQSVGGVKTLTSIPILPTASPSLDNHAVRKKYVDDIAVGLSWKKPVIDMNLSDPPAVPDIGDRYRVNPPGTGAWLGYNNHLMEWDGDVWLSDGTPQDGWAVFSTDDNKGWTYDGVTWIQFTGGLVYEAGDGLDLVGTTFSADLKANDGLEIDGTEITVDYDNSSIGIVDDELAVKSLGITNAMLAGSIADSKLNTISTADKVDWDAVNKTGSVLDDIEDVNAPAPEDDQALSWDADTGKWVPKTIAVDGGVPADSVMDVDVVSASQTAQTWTNMPAASTELFGNVYSRIKVDLTTATRYRLVVNQSVGGYAGADLNLQYSTDNVSYLAADTAGAGEVDVGTGVGVKVGSWADLVAGAKGDRWLRIVGKDGNGAADPAFRQIRIQFKVPGGAAIDGEAAIEFVIDGGGVEITTGDKGDLEIPFNCTINSATLLADKKGDIKVDIWVNSYADFPPTNGNTITNGNEPEIVSDDKYQDNTLTDWITALTKGQTMRINVDSCVTITRCTLSLKVNKT